MADPDIVHDAVERLEWDERKEDDNPIKRLRQFTRRTALTGGAAGIAAIDPRGMRRQQFEQQHGLGGRRRRQRCSEHLRRAARPTSSRSSTT